MGYLILYPPEGTSGAPVILGDEVGQNKAKRELGLPHYDHNGRYVSAGEIAKQEKNGAW